MGIVGTHTEDTEARFGAEPTVRIQMGLTPSATAEPASDRIGGASIVIQ